MEPRLIYEDGYWKIIAEDELMGKVYLSPWPGGYLWATKGVPRGVELRCKSIEEAAKFVGGFSVDLSHLVIGFTEIEENEKCTL